MWMCFSLYNISIIKFIRSVCALAVSTNSTILRESKMKKSFTRPRADAMLKKLLSFILKAPPHILYTLLCGRKIFECFFIFLRFHSLARAIATLIVLKMKNILNLNVDLQPNAEKE